MRQWRAKNKQKIKAYEIDHIADGRERARRYYWRHRQQRIDYSKRFIKTHAADIKKYRRSERYKALSKKHNEKARDRIRDFRLKDKYGIGLADYQVMLSKQNGVCLICMRKANGVSKWGSAFKNLSVDHCHKTGKVRGLLCHRCNWLIGSVEDNPDLMKRAILYLVGKL